MNKEQIEAIARLIASILLPVLTAAGIAMDGEELVTALCAAASVAAIIWSWWKNNNMTEAAQEAQKTLESLKGEE